MDFSIRFKEEHSTSTPRSDYRTDQPQYGIVSPAGSSPLQIGAALASIMQFVERQSPLSRVNEMSLRTHILVCKLSQAQADALNRKSSRIYTAVMRIYRKKGILGGQVRCPEAERPPR